jgi:hypothetical protein
MNDCPRLPADRRGKTEEQNKLVKQIESIVNDDPEFRNKVVHTTYRKIAFKNGYYDCDKKALRDYNCDVYFLMKGNIDFEESDECVRQEVWDKLFMGVFGTEEVSMYMLQSFARAMAGEIKDKRLFFIIGEPNSGEALEHVHRDLLSPEHPHEELVPNLLSYTLVGLLEVNIALHQEVHVAVVVTQSFLVAIVIPVFESYLSICGMHDLVSKLRVVVHDALDLLHQLVLLFCLTAPVCW